MNECRLGAEVGVKKFKRSLLQRIYRQLHVKDTMQYIYSHLTKYSVDFEVFSTFTV